MPNEMTREQIFRVLGEFCELGMIRIHLDGGEPLMHRLIGQIVDWLTDHGVIVSMNTNGALVPWRCDVIRKLSKIHISLDGPSECHDATRGRGSFARAIAGAEAARHAGVSVEFRCTVGRHNGQSIETLLEIAEALEIPVVFQPALNSLFLDTERDGSPWQMESQMIRDVFVRIEQLKRQGRAVGNAWSSLRHFPSFPVDTAPSVRGGLGDRHDGSGGCALPVWPGEPEHSREQRGPVGRRRVGRRGPRPAGRANPVARLAPGGPVPGAARRHATMQPELRLLL